MGILQDVHCREDLLKLSEPQKACLCREIREFLIESVSKTGGHLAGNLGVVELSVAIETVYDTRVDRLVFDVGHQSYVHKLLTGRQEAFASLRQFGGISGFPKPEESEADAFVAGHASSSVSIALGMARARTLLGQNYDVVALVGDGAATGGMIYEALNDLAVSKEPMVVILNDNEMSISRSSGGLSRHLSRVRSSQNYLHAKRYYRTILKKIPGGDAVYKASSRLKNRLKQIIMPGNMFENMGITYLGPADGHDLPGITALLAAAKEMREPVLVHVITKKGKGYAPAEKNPARFHGVDPFDIATGQPLKKKQYPSYTEVFSKKICELAGENKKIVAVTAAMPDGTGLTRFSKKFPDRFFDVGIAEAHAVTSAAGMASAGLKPVVAVYSSFLQRGYDQILHDVCLQKLPVLFAIDRAGLVGSDGETHQGIFDLSYLSSIPNMVIMSPKHKWELADMVRFGISYEGPIAIRYPRGSACDVCPEFRSPIEYGKSEILYEESDIAIIFVGHMFEEALKVREDLKEKGYDCSLINARFIKPLDAKMLDRLTKKHRLIVTIEENVKSGGFGEHVSEYLMRIGADVRVQILALPDDYVEHGNVDVLRKETGLEVESMTAQICKMYETM